MIALTFEQLASVTGGTSEAEELARVRHAANWYTNVFEKGAATASDMADKGAKYGAVIGFGGAAATGVGLPAAGLAALAGSGKGWLLGYGLGFATGAGNAVYETWSSRPWNQ